MLKNKIILFSLQKNYAILVALLLRPRVGVLKTPIIYVILRFNVNIKINESKSSNTAFILKSESMPSSHINNIPIPAYTETKLLDLILDRTLTWAAHVKNKRKTLNSHLHLFRPSPHSKMNIKKKTPIYKS